MYILNFEKTISPLTYPATIYSSITKPPIFYPLNNKYFIFLKNISISYIFYNFNDNLSFFIRIKFRKHNVRDKKTQLFKFTNGSYNGNLTAYFDKENNKPVIIITSNLNRVSTGKPKLIIPKFVIPFNNKSVNELIFFCSPTYPAQTGCYVYINSFRYNYENYTYDTSGPYTNSPSYLTIGPNVGEDTLSISYLLFNIR